MEFSDRYTRQILMDGWGPEGQRRVNSAAVGIAGVGGLGSPAATYLAAAGIGRLVLCDYQTVEQSNLNRQVLYASGDVGKQKTSRAAARLAALNADVDVQERRERISVESVDKVFGECDIILDCLDNRETRLVLNRYALASGRPLVHAGVRDFYGQIMLVAPPGTACLECVLSKGDHEEGPIPICGATAGAIGSMQAALALQWILSGAVDNAGTFLSVDLVRMSIHRVLVPRNPECPSCASYL